MVTKRFNNKYYMDEGFCIISQKGIKNVDKHTHNFVEFVYMINGKCVHQVDGIEYPTQKGDLLFLNYNSEHSIKANNYVTYADILIKPEYISDSLINSENVFSLFNLDGFEEFIEIINKENCLNDGFLKASNCDKMKFYIMWANHNANYLWDIRNSDSVDEAVEIAVA